MALSKAEEDKKVAARDDLNKTAAFKAGSEMGAFAVAAVKVEPRIPILRAQKSVAPLISRHLFSSYPG